MIQNWTLSDLKTLHDRYVARGITEGGAFNLTELRLEILRRNPNPFGTREMARKILELAQASDDGLTTYGELLSALRPTEAWKGNASVSVMGKALDRVAAYCIDNKLPLVNALVVNAAKRKLSAKAIQNIYSAARGWGLDTGPDAEAFVEAQIDACKALVGADLPDDKD